MNTEYFIARRFSSDKEGKKLMSRSIVRLSVFSISISILVMIITLAVITGFKGEIRNKVVGFGSHIQIINFDSNNSLESQPISANQDFLPTIEKLPGVIHVQEFATKPGIIKAHMENQGVFVKGVGPDFDGSFFKENLVEGKMLEIPDSGKTNDVLISKKLASMLRLKVGDDFPMFFFQDKPRYRRFHICGLYETSLDEFDKEYIIADIRYIQQLYGWDPDQISGFEITIRDYHQIEKVTQMVRDIAGNRFMADGSKLRVTNIIDKNPQIFDWLNLLDMNVKVILILMIIVAIVNMITGLIILILDRTNSIGLLKALGGSNETIRKIFIYQAFFLIVKGLIIGNVFALAFCFLEAKFQIIHLDQASYFINYVPVHLSFAILFITNVASLFIILLFMTLPTLIISRIDPVKTLRYA